MNLTFELIVNQNRCDEKLSGRICSQVKSQYILWLGNKIKGEPEEKKSLDIDTT